jgi:cyclopropane-fatty-acyl-phospholipid synthase
MQLADVFERLVGRGAPVEFSAYDGSRTGSQDAVIRVHLRSRQGLSYMVLSPGSLGMGRAYVAGELEIDGDMFTALKLLTAGPTLGALSWPERLDIVRAIGAGALRPAPRPAEEVRLRGRRHSKARDRAAVAHHYDVSNRFYEWVLGPSMAYTCAVYPHEDATLEEAQWEKHDLVARKLGLEPGKRLLDVGCGWGGMVMHAAQEYGVKALGVTLSRQQAEWAQKRIAETGLSELAEVRFLDYRDVSEGDFDAVSSIGLTEHIGAHELPRYFQLLRTKLRPGGRLLNHAIMRPTNKERPSKRDGFINRYVFPDGELMGFGHIASVMQDNGFEIRHEENIREHYARTLAAWGRNLDARWDDAIREVGAGRARVWRIYMAGCRLGFERRDIELHQLLGVKTAPAGGSGMPLRSTWERAASVGDATDRPAPAPIGDQSQAVSNQPAPPGRLDDSPTSPRS